MKNIEVFFNVFIYFEVFKQRKTRGYLPLDKPFTLCHSKNSWHNIQTTVWQKVKMPSFISNTIGNA